jgi:translation initiation factor 3 subunit L
MEVDYDDGLDAANIAAAQGMSRQQQYMGSEYYIPEGQGMMQNDNYMMPDLVVEFLRDFRDLVHRDVYVQDSTGAFKPDIVSRQEKLDGIHMSYQLKFASISERFYKQTTWPHPDLVYPILEDDVFLMLYKELYFRHVYARLGQSLTLEQRMESYDNYCLLFDRIFGDEDDMQAIDLPDQWLWDMVDEFVFQFHEFCRYRSKDLKKRTAAEIEALAAKPTAWDTLEVMGYLQKMVSKSEITQILRDDAADPEACRLHMALAGEVGITHVQNVLGYFSLVSMARVHVMCGDYYTALKTLDNLDFRGNTTDQVPMYMRVTSCYITLYYIMGFSYFMMRRFSEAVKALTQVLLYIQRTQHLAQPYHYEQTAKRSEQMYKLIAMCIALCPQRMVEDFVTSHLAEKYTDQVARLTKGDESMFEEFFGYAGPKSIYPGVPNYNDIPAKEITQALGLQWSGLLTELRQQHKLPAIRSYLKLYTKISTAKLAKIADMPEATLRAHVMCLKHKSRGNAAADFSLEKGVVEIADTRVAPTLAHFYIKHINKLDQQVVEIAQIR